MKFFGTELTCQKGEKLVFENLNFSVETGKARDDTVKLRAVPVMYGDMTRQVANILDIGAGIEVGVAATKTFLGQLLAFYGLALSFASRRQACSEKEIITPTVESLLFQAFP